MGPFFRGPGTACVALLALTAATAGPAAAGKQVAKVDARALAARIDQAIQQELDAAEVKASPRADDAEFLRRVYLDVTGVIPTADQARAFLDSKDPDKRAKLIDELLASPKYGRRLADVWQGIMLDRSSDTRRLRPEPLVEWMADHFNRNTPWDKLVTELLTATGPQDKNGAVTYFLSNNTVDKVTDSVCRLFLGVQLQCAQCHNHPFTEWKQTEYWAMAAFFMKVRPDNVNRAAKGGNSPGIAEAAQAPRGRNRLPESAKMVPAKFLQGEQPKLKPAEPFRPVLARWLTSADNPFFARAMVNRMWGQFFGRGFVNPVDNLHEGNPASHPELLDDLAAQFAANGFDLKYLVRAVCNSQTYQRTSKPYAGNEDDTTRFSHMPLKVLSPEQLYDSLTAVVGEDRSPAPRNRAQQQAAARRGPANARAQFVAFFNVGEDADPTEYQAGIPQALRLMNAPQLNRPGALLAAAQKAGSPAAAVEHLYLGTLSRRPTAAESARLVGYVEKQSDRRTAYGDVLWAILNSSEFTLNH